MTPGWGDFPQGRHPEARASNPPDAPFPCSNQRPQTSDRKEQDPKRGDQTGWKQKIARTLADPFWSLWPVSSTSFTGYTLHWGPGEGSICRKYSVSRSWRPPEGRREGEKTDISMSFMLVYPDVWRWHALGDHPWIDRNNWIPETIVLSKSWSGVHFFNDTYTRGPGFSIMASLVQRPEDSQRHPQGDGTGGKWELSTRDLKEGRD